MTRSIRTSPHLLPTACLVLSLGLVVPAPAQSRAATLAFVESSAEVGLEFVHFNGAAGQFYLPEEMGAGAALFDYDSDGDLDAFLIQGGALGPMAASSSAGPGSRLFRNDLIDRGKHSRLRFTDVTDRARIHTSIYGMGAATGDYDGNGYPDLFLTGLGSDLLYRNNGDGTFTDVTSPAGSRTIAGARVRRSSTTTAMATSICSSPTTSTSRSQGTAAASIRSARPTIARRASTVPFPIDSTGTWGMDGSPTRPRAPESPRPMAQGWALPPATTTATDGRISTSPTM
jgi:hypothetical protein